MALIADLVWARIQTMAEINDPAIPTAARASVGFIFILPTIAVSVIDNNGSAIPEMIAGIASLLICRKEILGTLFNELNVYQDENKTIKLENQTVLINLKFLPAHFCFSLITGILLGFFLTSH